MKHRIVIADTGETFPCRTGESVLSGMVRLGRRGIPLGCRGGGCGVCKVEVVGGDYDTKVMSRSHVSEDDLKDGRVLACRIFPRSDLRLRVVGKMVKAWNPKDQMERAKGKSE